MRPVKPVTPETTEVHGLTNEVLVDLPGFSHYADRILENLRDADIGGYMVTTDLALLERAIEKSGRTWDTDDIQVVDALRIWQTAEPRRLADAPNAVSTDR